MLGYAYGMAGRAADAATIFADNGNWSECVAWRRRCCRPRGPGYGRRQDLGRRYRRDAGFAGVLSATRDVARFPQ